jgi:hypothetical protein
MRNLRVFPVFLGFTFAALLPLAGQAQDVNPNYFYLVKGEPIARTIAVGDPSNWYTAIEGRSGESAGGKVKVQPVNFKGEQDAIQISWSPRKKVVGNFSLVGNAINLAGVKDAVTLTLDMRVDVKPNKNLTVSLDCGYPCKGELSINKILKTMPQGEWFSLPLPLNCFKGDNFDLSKITGPFGMATDGKFTVSIVNVRLEKLPEGDKGCVE